LLSDWEEQWMVTAAMDADGSDGWRWQGWTGTSALNQQV